MVNGIYHVFMCGLTPEENELIFLQYYSINFCDCNFGIYRNPLAERSPLKVILVALFQLF